MNRKFFTKEFEEEFTRLTYAMCFLVDQYTSIIKPWNKQDCRLLERIADNNKEQFGLNDELIEIAVCSAWLCITQKEYTA